MFVKNYDFNEMFSDSDLEINSNDIDASID